VAKSESSKPLLTEELAMRENRRVKMAKLSAMNTLAGFDFAFQPSLDTCPGARRIAVH
jgi:hypothetical protein